MDWIAGLMGSLLIAGAAYKKNSLSESGALAAVAVGTLLYSLGSLAWFGTLIMFFISSSLLSKWKRSEKREAEAAYEKTGRRDVMQVLANGGLAVLLCVGYYFWPHPAWWAAFVGVLATVNADTWATEVGGISKTAPRSILTGKTVPPGTSGGITPIGTTATFLGGLFIGLTAWLFIAMNPDQVAAGSVPASLDHLGQLLLIGGISGLAGSLTDSLLGAKYQLMYKCRVCGKTVERTEHCGQSTIRIGGLAFMNNDVVNVISSVVGGLVAVLVSALI